jgi:hypothetical protein
MEVHDGGQIEPAFAGGDVGAVAKRRQPAILYVIRWQMSLTQT